MADLSPRPDEDLYARHLELFHALPKYQDLHRPMISLADDSGGRATWPVPLQAWDLDDPSAGEEADTW